MNEHAELDALIEEAYGVIDTDDDQGVTEGDALDDRIAERVHAFETRLHRRLTQGEYDQIAFRETQKDVDADQDYERTVTGFLTDVDEQFPRLEAKLNRKLLQHEIDGIMEHGAYAVRRAGGPLDAEAAYERYWAHRKDQKGEDPPKDKTDDEYLAARVRDLNAQREAEAAAKAEAKANEYKVEFDHSGTVTAEHENAQRMQARMLELNGEPIPEWLEEFANPAYVAAQQSETEENAA